MAKETRPFSGHFDADDPRFCITAAGGCTWPTIPAYRYLAVSDNATGAWTFLNYTGFLIEQAQGPREHDTMNWNGIGMAFPMVFSIFLREWLRDEKLIRWTVQLGTVFCYQPTLEIFYEEPGKCNGIIELGDLSCIPAPGSTGTGFQLLPVQFDKNTPEIQWPLP